MALGVNKDFKSGILTADPQIDVIPSEKGAKTVVKFSIAFDHPHDRIKKKTDRRSCYLQVRVFGKTAEAAKRNLSKGDEVLIEGYLVQDSWPGKYDKKMVYAIFLEPDPMGLKYVRCKKLGIGYEKEKKGAVDE